MSAGRPASPTTAGAGTGTAARLAQAQEAQRKAEQALHAQNLRIVTLEQDLSNARDDLSRRGAEVERLQKQLAATAGGAGGAVAADRSKLRLEAVKAQWDKELAHLELQEGAARNLMTDVARETAFQMSYHAAVQLGKQEGEEEATERLRHRINALTFQLRVTQMVQIKKLREQIADLSHQLVQATASGSGAGAGPALPRGSVVLTAQECDAQQQQMATLRKELAVAEKARLELAGKFSETSREMREHRQNSLTALSEAQRWEAEAKRAKAQLQQELQKATHQLPEVRPTSLASSVSSATHTVDDSPREREQLAAQRELSELQLEVDDLQSQVAASGQRLAESERKLKAEREKAAAAVQRCTQLESEAAALRAGGAAPERRIQELQQRVDSLSDQLGEHRIAVASEKQLREKQVAEKEQHIAALQKNLATLQQTVASQSATTGSEHSQLRTKLAESDRALRTERTHREREHTAATQRISELESALTKATTQAAGERLDLANRAANLDQLNSDMQTSLNKAEAHNYELERKLTVSQRREMELERDLAIKVEQFALIAQQQDKSSNQGVQLKQASMKLDGARHSIAMLLLSQQYFTACLELFTESVAASWEENRRVRETQLIRDMQQKARDQIQTQELKHATHVEEMKRIAAQHGLIFSNLNNNNNNSNSNNNAMSGSSASALLFGDDGSSSSAANGFSGAGGGGGLNFGNSSPPAMLRSSRSSSDADGGSSLAALSFTGPMQSNSSSAMLAMQMALERKAFAYLAAMDTVAAHSSNVARLYVDSCILLSHRETEHLQRRLREQHTENSGRFSDLDSRLQILASEKGSLEKQLRTTQSKYEERVAVLTADVKDGQRREKDLRVKLEEAEAEQRKQHSTIATQHQELLQLQNYADDLKTSRELERSVLHARIQAAEEARTRHESAAGVASSSAQGTALDLTVALDAANLQIAREHAQVVELEGTVQELKSGVLKERRSRAALEATHREELGVLEQRLGEVRAELAALQLQRDPLDDDDNNSGGGGFGSPGRGGSELSRPHLQRELRQSQEKLATVSNDCKVLSDKLREVERKLATERDHAIAAKDRAERAEGDVDMAKKETLQTRKELEGLRSRHAGELVSRDAEFDKARRRLLEKATTLQEEVDSLKLQLHTQEMEHMSALHKVERHCLDRIATAEGEAASSTRSMHEELQDRRERVALLEKKVSALGVQLDNREQLLRTSQEHVQMLQTEQQRHARADETELSRYRQELRDLSTSLVDAKRSQIAAADRARHVMAASDAELTQLRSEVTQLRTEMLSLESRHRSELLARESGSAADARDLRTTREQLEDTKQRLQRAETESTAEKTELRKRVESLLEQVSSDDVVAQLRRAQTNSDLDHRRIKEVEGENERLRSLNNQLEAEADRLRVRASQLELDVKEVSEKLLLTTAMVDARVEQAVGQMARKVEAEGQLWEATAASSAAQIMQLQRLLLEEQRTSTEAALRMVQLEAALDDLEVELVTTKHAHSSQLAEIQQQSLQQQQQQQDVALLYSSSSSRSAANASPMSAVSASGSPRRSAAAAAATASAFLSREEKQTLMSSARQRLVQLPSLTQVIASKQTARLELERVEFERRTEIESDVFEWRRAVGSFILLLQGSFHTFSMQLMRASDHASYMEAEVSNIESDVSRTLQTTQHRSRELHLAAGRALLCAAELEDRVALVHFAMYQWTDSTRMLARELSGHACSVLGSNRRLLGSNAGLVQQQRDVFLFHRRQLQDFEMDNRHCISYVAAESLRFFYNSFRFCRVLIHSYEKKIRTLGRRLEIVISSERDVNDTNLAVLSRKAVLMQQHQLQLLGSRNPNNMQQQIAASQFGASSSLNAGQTTTMTTWNASVLDANLRAMPEFKRPDLARGPLEIIQRDELVQRRLLQDLFLDWITSTMVNLLRR